MVPWSTWTAGLRMHGEAGPDRLGVVPAAGRGTRPLPSDAATGGYGRPWTCGPTALDQALPAVASQFVDQVIAPRRPGIRLRRLEGPAVRAPGQAVQGVVHDGRDDIPAARAARWRPGRRGRPGTGSRPPSSWMQASAVRKSTEPWRVDLAVAAEHRTAVVVLHVDDREDVLDVQRRLEVLRSTWTACRWSAAPSSGPATSPPSPTAAQRLRHVGRVEAVLQVDVDAVEAVLLHQGVGAEFAKFVAEASLVDRDGALLAADRDDDRLPGRLLRRDVGLELGRRCSRQPGRVEVEGRSRPAWRSRRRRTTAMMSYCDWTSRELLDGRAVVEVLPVAGQGVLGHGRVAGFAAPVRSSCR